MAEETDGQGSIANDEVILSEEPRMAGKTMRITRRTAMQAVAALPALSIIGALAQEPVPNSGGTEAPKLKAPVGSCDCHHHIYDPARFLQPAEAKSPIWPNARVQEYRLLQRRLGTSRDVVVTPSAYATDNRVTLDAISQLGPNARGVAVVGADVSDAELKTLNAGGIRGIRFSLTSTTISSAAMERIEGLSGRVASLGWHTQFQTTADQVVELKDVLNRLPCALVFDHMGHVSPSGLDHPAYQIIRRLIDKGRSWVKLSVTFDNTKDGSPGYADLTAVAEAFVKAAPERLVWGSNWPHPNEKTKPDDAMLFDLLEAWAPSDATKKRILVENPEALYGFAKIG